MNDAVAVFKCLADKSRVRIITNLIHESMYVELLAERLDLAASTVSFHLKKLEGAGLVTSYKDQYYTMYKINEEVLKKPLQHFIVPDDEADSEEKERQEAYREKIIKNFFHYGKLKNIPVQRKKRVVILEEIAKAFEFNRDYTEREVNIIIADFHDDFCTLRREFIMEKLFEREDSIYRRVR